MIIFLYGADGYRLSQNKETIIASYRAKHSSGLNLRIADGSDPTALSIVTDAVKSNSFFKEVKLIVLKNCFEGKNGEALLELLENHNIATDKECVFLATYVGSEREAKPKELFSFLASKGNLVRNFKPLEGPQRIAWFKKEALARGAPFEGSALKKFSDLVGDNSWGAMNELDKLASYCQGPITTSAVELLVRSETEPNIFNFIEALGERDNIKAFSLLFREINFGRDPYYLLSMVAYQFRNMLAVKDLLERGVSKNLIAKESGLHPFVARKIIGAVAKFSPEDLRAIYKQILSLEINSKSGTANLEDSLFQFVLTA